MMQGNAHLVRQTSLLAVSSATERLTGLLVTVIVGRFLGAMALGEYSTVLALWNVLGTVAYFGQQKQVGRDVARNPESSYEYLTVAATITLLASICAGALMVVIAHLLSYGLTVILGSAISALSFMWADAQCATVESVLISRNKVVAIAIINMAASAARAAASLVVLIWDMDILTLLGLIGITQIASAIALYVVTLITIKTRRPTWKRDLAGQYVRGGSVIMVSNLSAMLIQRIDTLLLGRSNALELGIYSAANRLAQIPALLATPVFRAILPVYARARLVSSQAVTEIANDHVHVVGFVFGSLSILFGLGGPWMLRVLFGSSFDSSAASLIVLTLATVPLMLKYLFSTIALSTDLERPLLGANLANGLVCVILDLVLIPTLGALGASLVFLVVTMMGAWQTGLLLSMRRLLVPHEIMRAALPSLAWSFASFLCALASEAFHLPLGLLALAMVICLAGHTCSHRSVAQRLIKMIIRKLSRHTYDRVIETDPSS